MSKIKSNLVKDMRADAGTYTDEEEANRKMLAFGRELLMLPDLDLSDDEAIERRITWYFDRCEELGYKPLINGLGQALGVSRSIVMALSNGSKRSYKNLTPSGLSKIEKAYLLLATYWENSLTMEKGNPVKWFFLGKNHFGYTDQHEQIVRHEDERLALKSPEEIAKFYAEKLGGKIEEIDVEVIDQKPKQLSEPQDF